MNESCAIFSVKNKDAHVYVVLALRMVMLVVYSVLCCLFCAAVWWWLFSVLGAPQQHAVLHDPARLLQPGQHVLSAGTLATRSALRLQHLADNTGEGTCNPDWVIMWKEQLWWRILLCNKCKCHIISFCVTQLKMLVDPWFETSGHSFYCLNKRRRMAYICR